MANETHGQKPSHEELKKTYALFLKELSTYPEILQALAEEASELSAACLRAMRASGIGPKSRKTEKEAVLHLLEEISDVLLNVDALLTHPDTPVQGNRMTRTEMKAHIVKSMDEKMKRHMGLFHFPWESFLESERRNADVNQKEGKTHDGSRKEGMDTRRRRPKAGSP